MRKLLFFAILLFWASCVRAQNSHSFQITPFNSEISFISTDSTHGSQATLIEYPEFLVIIELPFIDAGANIAANLSEDIPKAEQFLAFLKHNYRNKPVKYVLSTHWHLHSLSGITPFFKQGATLVTAKTNWEYSIKHGLLDDSIASKYKDQVIQVTADMTILQGSKNPVEVLFLDQTYTHKPTEDYLFFYLPNCRALHASCMCAMSDINFEQRPEFIYSDRLTDLGKAIQSRQLEVAHLIKLTAEYDREKGQYKMPAFTGAYYTEFKQRGRSMESVVEAYCKYDLQHLKYNKDSILSALITRKVSSQVINATVYACIRQKAFEKAVAWADILNTYHPGEVNFIDTMGEAYYNANNMEVARHLSNLLLQKDPESFPNAIRTWEENRQKK